MSLAQPHKKMSKSDYDSRSRILITDSDDLIHAKILGARTDSDYKVTYDPDNRPGVSNLIDLLYHMGQGMYASPEDAAFDCKDLQMRAFKIKVATTIAYRLADIRERYNEILHLEDGKYLDEVAAAGASKAQASAAATMDLVRDAVGL